MRYILILLLAFVIPKLTIAQEELPASVVEGMNRLRKKESRYWNEADWENHMRICHEFLVNYEQYLDDEKKAMWNVKIAGTFIELKSYLLAVEYLQKGIKYADQPLKSFAYSQLGRSYIDLGEYDKAADSYKSALKSAKDIERKVAHTNSLGFVFYQAGLFRDARSTYQSALSLFEKNPQVDSIQYFIIQSNLASLDFAERNHDSGMQRLYELERSFRPIDTWFHVEVYLKMLPILVENEDCTEVSRVLSVLKKVLGESKISEARLKYLEFSLRHANSCSSVSDAQRFQKEYFMVNEALKDQEIDRLIIIEKLQRDELKRRLKLVSDNLKLKKESEKQYFRLVVVSVSLLVLVLVGALLWWRTVRSRQKRKEKYLKLREEFIQESAKSAELKREMEAKELENKKLELKQTLQSMNNNSTLLEEIQGRLNSMRNQEEGIQDSITDLIQFLKSHAGAQAVNELIEQNVETIGGDFRDRFFAKHESFTASEVQLVLLLRIGLSTKEVALMKSVEPSSVRIFKHRLKSKLGLDKSQDLTNYIQNF